MYCITPWYVINCYSPVGRSVLGKTEVLEVILKILLILPAQWNVWLIPYLTLGPIFLLVFKILASSLKRLMKITAYLVFKTSWNLWVLCIPVYNVMWNLMPSLLLVFSCFGFFLSAHLSKSSTITWPYHFVFVRDKWDKNHVRMPCSRDNLYPGQVK